MKYQKIVDDLSVGIRNGTITAIPTIKQLKADYGVGYYTVRAALMWLTRQGLIENDGRPNGRHVLTPWARTLP